MGHYYKLTGEPCYEIVGKNGKSRGTNIADARKLGLVPSVTTIMDVQSKPALINWIQNQLIEACIDTPFYSGLWSKEEYKKYLISRSKQIGKDAADRGTLIHDKLELWANDGYETHEELGPDIKQAVELLQREFPDYILYPENSFAHRDGFGGKVDLWGADKDNNCIIIDYKTKDKADEKDLVQYDDHCIQLAAYQVGLQLPANTRRFNLFISVHPDAMGMCKLVECKEFDKYRDLFYALKDVWCLKNNYQVKGLMS